MQKGHNPCMYFKNRESALKTLTWDPLDIEQLHEVAKKKIFCPYYAMKDRMTGADLIFMPYNYLVDEKIRENFDINFENSILIFDEAHNITSTCEEQASFSIETKNLDMVLRELTELQDVKRQNEDKTMQSTDEDISHCKLLTGSFKQYLDNFDLSGKEDRFNIQNNFLSKSSCVLPGSKIFEIMFFGTKFSDLDVKTQAEKTYTLKEHFYSDIS